MASPACRAAQESTMRRTALAVVLGAALLAAGCGGLGETFGSPDRDRGAAPGGAGRTLVCGDATFEEGDLATMPGLATLPDDVQAAVDDTGTPAVDATLDWRVAEAAEDAVVLIRPLDPAEPAAGQGDSHATMRLGPITGAPNIADGTWFVWGGATCSPRLAEGAGDDQAEVRLAAAPAATDTELALLVMERRCASGQSAEGRIRLDGLEVTADEVRVRISVSRPPGDAQTCQGNPWTPFTVDLDEPVGGRTVVDANLVPPRPLPVGADG